MSTLLDYEEIERQTDNISLTIEDYTSLFDRLEREAELAREVARRQAHARAWELAKQQGVEPIRSIDDLRGDFWPEEESVDEFLEWVRTVRRQDKAEQRSEQ